MRTDKRDKSLDEWLRRPRPEQSAAGVDECPDAETLAAWLDGGLSSEALDRVLTHAAACARCETIVATMVRAEPVQPTADADAHSAAPSWHRWFRWALPTVAAATAVVALAVWVRTPQPQSGAARFETSSLEERAADGRAVTGTLPQGTPGETPAAPGAVSSVQPAAPVAPVRPMQDVPEPRSQEELNRLRQRPLPASAGSVVQPTERSTLPGNDAVEEPARTGSAVAENVGPGPAEMRKSASGISGATERPEASTPDATATARPPSATATRPAAPSAADSRTAAASIPSAAAPTTAAEATRRDSVGAATAQAAAPAFSPAATNRVDDAAAWTIVTSPSNRQVYRFRERSIEYSTDGGKSWSGAIPGSPAALLAGVAVSENAGWFVGERGTVVVATNGRTAAVPVPASLDLVSVRATNGLVASVTTRDGRVFTTADGGRTWRAQ